MDLSAATVMTALGHALVHFLWQGALIGALAALALQALRDARPQARYAVACLALLACVLAPLATLLAQLAAATPAPAVFIIGSDVHVGATPAAGEALFGLLPTSEILREFLPWVVALWAAGASAMSLRMAMGLIWIQRLRNAPQDALQAAWQVRLDALATHFGLRRSVALRIVERLDTPVSAGWWKPVVLLPAGLLTRMPTDLLEALLAHELAHIRRHDYLVNLLQNAIEALLFYHPVTWWLSRRIRAEREQIADQLAAEVACAPRRLAVALYELSGMPRTHPPLRLAQAARGGQLMSRIEQLVRPTRRAHPSARIVFPLLGLAAACLATYTYAQATRPAMVATATAGAEAARAARSRGPRESFALVPRDGNSITMWGSTDDIPAIKAAQRTADGEFLWVRRGSSQYVITDPATLAKARKAWSATDASERKMEALEAQMDVHEKKMDALNERMEALTEHAESSPEAKARERAMADMERQHDAIQREQEALQQRMQDVRDDDSAEQERISREMEALSTRLERLSERQSTALEQEMQRLHAPMEALSREMEAASKPMEALGKQMEAIGREHEKAAQQAERELSAVVSEALAKGLARPAPAKP